MTLTLVTLPNGQEKKINPALHWEYAACEYLAKSIEPSHPLDIVYCLSGRTNFDHNDTQDYQSIEKERGELVDRGDTLRRLRHALTVARTSHKIHGHYPLLYFNGSQTQNTQLRRMVSCSDFALYYPPNQVVIEDLPPGYVSTIGQALTFRLFVETHYKTPPTIGLITSTYHTPRSLATHAHNSPLLTEQYAMTFKPNLPANLLEGTRKLDSILNRATLLAFPCDPTIATVPGSAYDLPSDMEGRQKYAFGDSPTNAKNPFANEVRVGEALSRFALLSNRFKPKPPQEDKCTMTH